MERSSEFLEGYNACNQDVSRTRNPYKPTNPLDLMGHKRFQEWSLGWSKRFYQEPIDSAP